MEVISDSELANRYKALDGGRIWDSFPLLIRRTVLVCGRKEVCAKREVQWEDIAAEWLMLTTKLIILDWLVKRAEH